MLESIKKLRKLSDFKAIDDQKGVFAFISLFFIISLIIAFTFDGTGDAGDAIAHYHFARFAFAHPEHFFNHWAKPLFVLLAAPFAQFGFIGIKIFNIICVTISLVFTYKIAQKLNLPNAWLAPFILATCSGYFTLMFSGLTEFLCAAMLSVAFYQYIAHKNWLWATILISFLPFVRSEGLLIIGVVSVFLIVKKRWSLLPLLAIGHIVYAFAGYVVHKDLGWVFNKMTYATLSAYGSGSLFHFVDKLYYLTGLPHFLFWIIGTIGFLVGILRGSLGKQAQEITFLIFGSFFTFLIAHSLFWYLGIFLSFGLIRVMNAVMPFFALISLFGFNFFIHSIKNVKAQNIVKQLIIIYFIVFQAIPHPSSINWKTDLSLDEGQVFAKDAALFLKEKYPNHTYFYLHPQIPLTLNMDNFDKKKFRDFSGIRDSTNLKTNAIFVWDNLFCVLDAGIHLEEVMKNSKLEVVKSYETVNKSHQLVLFKVK
jgi:hypothetical protein